MKKFLFTILILTTMFSNIHASIQGQMFFELNPYTNNQQTLSTTLHKIYQHNIKVENIKEALLHIDTGDSSIIVEDINLEKEYTLQEKAGAFNISEILKQNIQDKENNLVLKIQNSFCTQNCKANKYPYVKLLYTFNNPPTIQLIRPQEQTVFESQDVFFQWEGIDNDGKFLEYLLEVSTNRLFQNNVVFNSGWIKEKEKTLSLPEGMYFWRVNVRDNSFLNNVVQSEVFSFQIKFPSKTDTPIKEITTEEIKIPEKPTILSPENGMKTNSKEILLLVKTESNVQNLILLNETIQHETNLDEISLALNLTKEGENNIRVISQRDGYASESSLKVFAHWTPPSNPDFDFKVEEGKIFLQIKNQDYIKAYIYVNNNLFKETQKNTNWIEMIEDTGEEIRFGVMLEDDLGNKTNIVYKAFSSYQDVLGIGGAKQNMPEVKVPQASICTARYNKTKKTFKNQKCNISKPIITEITNTTKDKETFHTTIYGVYNPDFVVLIDEYECKYKFPCIEKFIETKKIELATYTAVSVYIDRQFKSIKEFQKEDRNFFSAKIFSDKDFKGLLANTSYFINHGFNFDGKWIELEFKSRLSGAKKIPPVTILPQEEKGKFFRFPFNKNIGVTQWHGYTAYQSPHTGIDFGSYKEPLYAVADGVIREAGWDNYYGECLTGGYFIRIEHTNGMNSVYLHLENYKKNNGVDWQIGQEIKKGELIGITGNTGFYNCQPLGYHLHFELRKDSKQVNHLNPVPYIDVDWDNILTLQHTKYPGRLTGNNPHPKY